MINLFFIPINSALLVLTLQQNNPLAAVVNAVAVAMNFYIVLTRLNK